MIEHIFYRKKKMFILVVPRIVHSIRIHINRTKQSVYKYTYIIFIYLIYIQNEQRIQYIIHIPPLLKGLLTLKKIIFYIRI